MFAIPIVAQPRYAPSAPVAATCRACGFVVSLLAIFFTIYPIIDVPSPLFFAVKIVAVTLTANAMGDDIFAIGDRRRPAGKLNCLKRSSFSAILHHPAQILGNPFVTEMKIFAARRTDEVIGTFPEKLFVDPAWF